MLYKIRYFVTREDVYEVIVDADSEEDAGDNRVWGKGIVSDDKLVYDRVQNTEVTDITEITHDEFEDWKKK